MKDFTPSDDEKENNRIFDMIMGDGDSDKAWRNYEESRRMLREEEDEKKHRWHDKGDVNSDPYSPHDPKEKTWTPSRPSPFDKPKEADRRPPYEYPHPPEEQDEPHKTPFEPRTEPSPYDEPPKEPRMPPYPPTDDDTDDPSLNKAVFDTAFDLMKFGDCPVCLGDPAACPSPDEPMSECGTRRNAIKHMIRGKGGRPPITPR
jgi:hypothetical protein